MTNEKKVTIHTDGSCIGNPGKGGWGAVLECNGKTKEIYGGIDNTTNNQMELKAAIEALKALKRSSLVDLHTDSTYVKNGITSWIISWKKNNWKTASRKPVKNVDLWKQLDEEVQKHNVTWFWVKGHAGNIGNEKADELANKGANEV